MDIKLVKRIRKANERSLARLGNHPFVKDAWRKKLTREQALHWPLAAGWDSREFRDMLERLSEELANSRKYKLVYQILVENLEDENGNGNPNEAHWRHYIHLVQQLGYSEKDLLGYQGKGGVQYAVGMARNVHLWSPAQAVGYMLINESATPITYEAAKEALEVFFTLSTCFFRLHIEVDVHHVNGLYEAVKALPNKEFKEVLRGIKFGERGMAAILDEAFGVFGSSELSLAA